MVPVSRNWSIFSPDDLPMFASFVASLPDVMAVACSESALDTFLYLRGARPIY